MINIDYYFNYSFSFLSCGCEGGLEHSMARDNMFFFHVYIVLNYGEIFSLNSIRYILLFLFSVLIVVINYHFVI